MAPGQKLTIQCSLLHESAAGAGNVGIEAILTGDAEERLSIGNKPGIEPK
jgi:hypothetical protein